MTDPTTTTAPPRRPRRGHGRPTLHDVAQAAGVTRITVSRFIRAPDTVAPDTAARIQAAIRSAGYVPNHPAGHLASGRSRIVAALIPNVGHSIFAETIQGLTEGLHGSGHELLLLATGYSLEREEAQLRALVGWAPGALVVTGRQHSAGALQLLRDAQAAGTPVVEIWDRPQGRDADDNADADADADNDGDDAGDAGDRAAAKNDTDAFAQIGFDHAATGRAMARHLLDRGHACLAYIDSGVTEDFRAHERGEGFAAEAKAAGARVAVLRAATGDAFDAGRAVLARLIDGAGRGSASRRPITAAAFANDHLAAGALLQAAAAGVDVPGRLALLGFGDFPVGRQLRPALSTVRPPRAEIGRVAAAALLQALASGAAPAGRAMPCELVARDSTRRG